MPPSLLEIDRNRKAQNQDVGGDERHVEGATGLDQPRPSVALGQQEISERDDWKQEAKLE